MNLQKINEKLTKVMISTFVGIMALCFITIVLPIVAYALVVLLYVLMFVTFLTLATSTWLMVKEINKMIDSFFKQYEQQH